MNACVVNRLFWDSYRTFFSLPFLLLFTFYISFFFLPFTCIGEQVRASDHETYDSGALVSVVIWTERKTFNSNNLLELSNRRSPYSAFVASSRTKRFRRTAGLPVRQKQPVAGSVDSLRQQFTIRFSLRRKEVTVCLSHNEGSVGKKCLASFLFFPPEGFVDLDLKNTCGPHRQPRRMAFLVSQPGLSVAPNQLVYSREKTDPWSDSERRTVMVMAIPAI